VHAPKDEKSGESKVRCYEELEQISDYFPKCHIKFQLGEFNAKFWREAIFKLKIGNESLHGDINKNGVTALNVSTSKISRCSPIEIFTNTRGPLLI